MMTTGEFTTSRLARIFGIGMMCAVCLALLSGCSSKGTDAHNAGPAGRLYVLNQGDATMYVYDTRTHARIDSVSTGVKKPHYIEFSPDGRYFYITTLEATGHIAKFDAATNQLVDSTPAPPAVQPTAIAITTDSRYGYICNFSLPGERTFIYKFDLNTLDYLSRVQAGSVTHDVKTTADGRMIVACNMKTDDLTLVYPGADTVAFVNVDPDSVYGIQSMPKYGPHGVVIDHKDSLAFIACMMKMQVRVLDIATRTIVDSIDIPTRENGPLFGPTLLAISPDDKTVYLTTSGGNSVVAFDVPTMTVRADIPLATANSFGISISDDGSRVYAACVGFPLDHGRVYVIDGKSLVKLDSLDVGRESFGLVWRPAGM